MFYMNYELRPLDENLKKVCAKQFCCTNCSLRVGCLVRFSLFYQMDFQEFEFFIQTVELGTFKDLKEIGLTEKVAAEEAFKVTNSFRIKRNIEISNYPKFSFI